ncbi:MAG: hypothetical protein D084_Lepto4C00082G0003, partial [Leptospirillum sp. Group IV 'UBA BS']
MTVGRLSRQKSNHIRDECNAGETIIECWFRKVEIPLPREASGKEGFLAAQKAGVF